MSTKLTAVSENTRPSSDYLDVSEIKVRKPKKKKSKSTRQKTVDPDDYLLPDLPEPPAQEEKMDVDTTEKERKRKQSDDMNLVDDDDLQFALSMQRRNALKKRKRTRPEDIAKELKETPEEQDGAQEEGEEGGGIVIGEVSEFVAGIKKAEEEEEERPRKKQSTEPPAPAVKDEAEEDVPMQEVDAYLPTQEEHDEEKEEPAEGDEDFMEEKTVGQGLGATLSLLRDRGVLRDSDSTEKHETMMKKTDFLAKKRRIEAELDEAARAQRERDRASGRLERMSQREQQEYARQQNAQRDLQASRRIAELYEREFRPTFEIRYADEEGRVLDRKEAFKHLSHQFHGKGSGKGKTDKKIKKVADDQRREAQSVLDAGRDVGMSSVTAQQLKKRREAGVRLA